MIDLIGPQRFYQFKFSFCGNERVETVIDLKVVSEVSLRDLNGRKEVIIATNNNIPPRNIQIEETEVAEEVYSKLVKAWTTYKLATER
ncbi:hypothetical protein H9660_03640 [Clostridium sp. Sa3CUN1]|uniref:DUF304 domain-containing protein n=1 Tax=Clostridium gallinarum TaxID=2762246 RepID=A0ABR8Q1D3_9CLOT|nr:hypothetical protein [Clostridium gallinarum]MBD7914231.1 hypothetical protein [Clostridium gallinarum]